MAPSDSSMLQREVKDSAPGEELLARGGRSSHPVHTYPRRFLATPWKRIARSLAASRPGTISRSPCLPAVLDSVFWNCFMKSTSVGPGPGTQLDISLGASVAFLHRGHTPRVKPGQLRAHNEADSLTYSLSVSGQVNNATARVMTNKKPGNPYANGENPRLPACFRLWSRSLGKLRQPKGQPSWFLTIALIWCPSFPTFVLSERSGQLRQTAGSPTPPTELVSPVSTPELFQVCTAPRGCIERQQVQTNSGDFLED